MIAFRLKVCAMNVRKLAQFLSEIGFLASKYMMFEKAEEIHQTIEKIYPGKETSLIGEGYNLICSKRFEEAISILSKRVNSEKGGSDLLKSFLGLAYFESNQNSHAQRVLSEVMKGTDQIAKNMANDLLNLIKKER